MAHSKMLHVRVDDEIKTQASEALAAMEPTQRQQLRLRRGLVLAAGAAARAAAAAAVLGPGGSASDGSSSSGSESDDQQVQVLPAKQDPAEGGQLPLCSNPNEERPLGSSFDEEPA